jgi:DNA sulfur modification protein DndD
MKIKEIKIQNFRQYYGTALINLETNEKKNLVIIGGKNGYGKTNFLLSIVWCLYGDKMAQIDDNFKKEIQKDKNYSNFMSRSINHTAQKNDTSTFSVQLIVNDLDLPDIPGFNQPVNAVVIKREFDVASMTENFTIVNHKNGRELFTENNDKLGFIDDYIIPLDAAKFVFFDAEKIAEIANLSRKEEGSFLNDALGKILGLDIFEILIEDFTQYKDNLKRKGADTNLNERLLTIENSIKASEIQIENSENTLASKEAEIQELKKEIKSYEALVSQHSKQSDSTVNRENLILELDKLREKEKELELRFSELSEIIPLAILTGKLEEVNEHLEIQANNEIAENSESDFENKMDTFIEALFNEPPQPENPSMNAMERFFYIDKAKELGNQIFTEDVDFTELEFEFDLNNAEKSLIKDSLQLVNSQSKSVFQNTIEEINSTKNDLETLERTLRKVDADLEDELVLEYTSEKETREKQMSLLYEEIGASKTEIQNLHTEINRGNKSYQNLLKKAEVNSINRKKIKEAEKYSSSLKDFVREQKAEKKESLANNILMEMQNLMHKLKANKDRFVQKVDVTILPEGKGMLINLYNADNEIILKEELSAGEKQIYISSLIKAILKESVRQLPIFIDTPLGRLDSEHRDSITKEYYPDLSEQVVLFSTNSEITPRRYREIEAYISKSYLLVNNGVNTHIEEGYFKNASND